MAHNMDELRSTLEREKVCIDACVRAGPGAEFINFVECTDAELGILIAALEHCPVSYVDDVSVLEILARRISVERERGRAYQRYLDALAAVRERDGARGSHVLEAGCGSRQR